MLPVTNPFTVFKFTLLFSADSNGGRVEAQLKETNLIQVSGQDTCHRNKWAKMKSSACQAPININMLQPPSTLNPYNSVRQVPNSSHMTCDRLRWTNLTKVTE